VEIQISSSINELTNTITINKSGTGSANYTSLVIYPVESTVSITSSNTLLVINGANNVIIDGRVNRLGTHIDLHLISTSSTGDVIKFNSGSKNNILQYCRFWQNAPTTGLIMELSDVSSTDTNNHIAHNTISNNEFRITNITSYDGTQTGLYIGQHAHHNMFNDNHFVNIFPKNSEGNSGTVYLHASSYANTVTSNHFYQMSPYN